MAADGTKIGNGGEGTAVNATVGNNEWEEVYVEVRGFKEGSATCSQIHVVFGGASKRGDAYFKDGVLQGNPNFDVAAWGIFPNLASAKAYDLKTAAVNGVE